MKRNLEAEAAVHDALRELPEKVRKIQEGEEQPEDSPEPAFISPSTERPNREAQLYDRQLRLWQSSGQKRIGKAAVKICDCSATSSQIAKNLILSGVKCLDMFDDQQVRKADIGHHFFLDQESLGRNRSKECCRLLGELPPPYKGADYNEELLDANYFEGFDDLQGFDGWQAHICVRLISDHEEVTSRYCWDFNVPTILVQTCGLVAMIRTHIREKAVIPTDSNSSSIDLRLDCPFPSLSEFVNSFEMDKMDNRDHAHIPAVVIVIHFLDIFKSKHHGNLPATPAERDELKEMILAEKRNADEENFDEAVEMIWKACQPTKVPEHIEELFKNPHCDKIPWFDGRFWLLVKSLQAFVKQNANHHLPLPGVLPDMKSDTKNYTKLQSIYRQQASEDLETFNNIMRDTRQSIREESTEFEENITRYGYAEVPKFTKECEPGNVEYVVHWYLAFAALSAYRSVNMGEYPGMRKGQEQEDFDRLSKFALGWLKHRGWVNLGDDENKVPGKLEKVLKEMIRSAGSELPHIASLVGGLVAQEVIKLTTGQYIPMNGICIFDGYRSTTGILEF
ncbi:hypothetical protein PtB15_7B12 [Puccinia triticina]|nr:hypothetical protein PtB15_7B12 [Puccinia triticina]